MTFLSRYKKEDYLALTSYILDDLQSQFTAMPKDFLSTFDENNSLKFPITIFHEKKAVGFFVLDLGNDKFELSNNINSVLLRSLSINPVYQSKGIGKKVMSLLPNFVKEEFFDCNEIVLAVNFKNTSAYNLYINCGFIDDGKTRETSKGLQYLLSKKV